MLNPGSCNFLFDHNLRPLFVLHPDICQDEFLSGMQRCVDWHHRGESRNAGAGVALFAFALSLPKIHGSEYN